jgi:hypothetical protein
MNTHLRVAKSVVIASVLLCLGACDVEDERAGIEQAFAMLDEAFNACDGEAAVQLLTAESMEEYDRRLWFALHGTETQLRNLDYAELWDVLMMRCRSTAEELEGMNGRDWIVHAADQGWYADEAWVPWTLDNFTVDVDFARAEVIMDGEETGLLLSFYKTGGVWKMDFNCLDQPISEFLEQEASLGSTSVRKLLIAQEEAYAGKKIGSRVMREPMLKPAG